MILMDVIEQRRVNRADYSENVTPKEFFVHRELAQAMIPGKHLIKVEIEKKIFEEKMKGDCDTSIKRATEVAAALKLS